MLNYKIFANNKDITDKFAKSSKIYGTLFIILGAIGIIYPNVISLTSSIFIGWLMLLAGFFVAIQTWQVNKKDWLGWLKALLYLVVGALTILNPVSGVIALAILFSIYFFVDSVINLTFASNFSQYSPENAIKTKFGENFSYILTIRYWIF